MKMRSGAADHIVDIGPGAGVHGGQVIAQGTAAEIMQIEESITGQFLSGKQKLRFRLSVCLMSQLNCSPYREQVVTT